MSNLLADLARVTATFQQRAIVTMLQQQPATPPKGHPTAEALRQQWAKYRTAAGPMTDAVEAAADLIDRQAETIALYQSADLARYLGSNLKPVKLSETPA